MGTPTTRVEILCFDGCPNVQPTIDRVRSVAARLGVEIELRSVRVESPDHALRERFLGSPTVRVNGIDVEPSARDRSDFGLSCRVYGGGAIPPETMIATALQGSAAASSTSQAGLAVASSLFAAVLSSACCWLPLLLVAAGVSAGGVAIAFAPFRPWLIAFAVVALAFGFWLSERRSRAADACGCTPASRRRRTLNRIMLAVSAIGVIAFALFPRYVDSVLGQRPPVKTSRAAHEVTLRVAGMTCTGCETGIETALRRLPGVVLVDASYDDGTVVVGLAPDASPATDALIQVVAQAGYSALPLESTPSGPKAYTPSVSVRLLTDDTKPLADSFNAASSRIRFLAILSPT